MGCDNGLEIAEFGMDLCRVGLTAGHALVGGGLVHVPRLAVGGGILGPVRLNLACYVCREEAGERACHGVCCGMLGVQCGLLVGGQERG